jgi:hypothetical protein
MIHKKEGMVDVKSIKCKHANCKKQPTYNMINEKKPLYCNDHKLNGMCNIVTKTCVYKGCRKQRIYNVESELTPIYCSEHKSNDMVNKRHKICEYEGCQQVAAYNLVGEKILKFCYTHKSDGMTNMMTTKCKHEGCTKTANFNIAGEKKSMYCASHKKEGMVNVKSKTCIECNTIPFFNKPGEKIGLYCSQHKLNGMVHINNKTCKSEWCSTYVQEKYDGYCVFCYMNLFPDKPVTRNYKTKEYAVVEYVKTKFKDFSWIADKKVSDGCSKRRPDLLLDLGYQIIVVEVDENQHTDYDCSCENKRTMELSQDLGHRPIVFIRFNPDEYTKNETNISSCWGVDKKGICVVKKSKKEEWAERLKCLVENINYWITPENTTSKTVEIIQLYYDM